MADKETAEQKKAREIAERLKATDDANSKLEKESDDHLAKHKEYLADRKAQDEASK